MKCVSKSRRKNTPQGSSASISKKKKTPKQNNDSIGLTEEEKKN
jgi:hypothetical protein